MWGSSKMKQPLWTRRVRDVKVPGGFRKGKAEPLV
jgi:hypothetical protein